MCKLVGSYIQVFSLELHLCLSGIGLPVSEAKVKRVVFFLEKIDNIVSHNKGSAGKGIVPESCKSIPKTDKQLLYGFLFLIVASVLIYQSIRNKGHMNSVVKHFDILIHIPYIAVLQTTEMI